MKKRETSIFGEGIPTRPEYPKPIAELGQQCPSSDAIGNYWWKMAQYLEAQLAFREQQIKDACAILVKESIESAPGVTTPAHEAYKILWRYKS